jgi:hypothetical protein
VKRSPRSPGNIDAPSKEQYEHSLEDELVGQCMVPSWMRMMVDDSDGNDWASMNDQ